MAESRHCAAVYDGDFSAAYRIRYNNLIQVRYSPFTSEWRIGNKSAAGMYDIMSTETYGTHRATAYKIFGGHLEFAGLPHL